MHRSRNGLRRHHRLHAHQRPKQIQRMDRLSQQHPTTIPRHRSASRLIIISLRPPPRHQHPGRGNNTQLTAIDRRPQPHAGSGETWCCQHNPQRAAPLCPGPPAPTTRPARQSAPAASPPEQHVSPRANTARQHPDARPSGSQHQHRLNVRIGNDTIDIGRNRKPKPISKRLRPAPPSETPRSVTSTRSAKSSRLFRMWFRTRPQDQSVQASSRHPLPANASAPPQPEPPAPASKP